MTSDGDWHIPKLAEWSPCGSHVISGWQSLVLQSISRRTRSRSPVARWERVLEDLVSALRRILSVPSQPPPGADRLSALIETLRV